MMRVNWTKCSAIAEIIAAISVVITLIVLIASVRDNTSAIRASTFQSSLDGHSQLSQVVMNNPSLARLVQKFITGETDDLDEAERFILSEWVGSLFRSYNSSYVSNVNELLGDNEWERFDRLACRNFSRAEEAGYLSLLESLMTLDFMEHMKEECPG